MEKSVLGSRIKKNRELKNLTQEYMAHLLNISQNAYSKIENGSVKLSVERLISIAEILEIPLDEIISNDTQSFTFNNSTIDKFYGYIETIQEENKELLNTTIKILTEQLHHSQKENIKLLEIISQLNKNSK